MRMCCGKAGPSAQSHFVRMVQKGIAKEKRDSRERCAWAALETVPMLCTPDQEPGKVTSRRDSVCKTQGVEGGGQMRTDVV